MDRKRMAGKSSRTCTFGAKIKKYNYNFFKFQFEIALNGYLDKCLTWISLNALRKIQFTIGTNFWNTLYLKDSVNNSSQWCLEENGWFPTGSLGFYYANILREIFTILYQKIYGLSAMALQRAVFGTISNYSCIFACSYSLSHLFPPDYNYTCGGAGGGGQMGWKRDLCNIGYPSNTTPALFKSQKILFSDSTGFKFTPTKRRLTTSHLPILEPVLKRAIPSYKIYSNLTFYGLFPLSFSRFCDTRIFS